MPEGAAATTTIAIVTASTSASASATGREKGDSKRGRGHGDVVQDWACRIPRYGEGLRLAHWRGSYPRVHARRLVRDKHSFVDRASGFKR
ncbi:MAG: hypothetical protein U5K33_08725, partial [Halofilum sp. (in: g-proteobacteria)]|nr:hypothetical protein [Halofilum sp. (in: g-proteobacteria)]